MLKVDNGQSGVGADELACKLESMVLSGQLGPGQKLPSVRMLAKQYKVGVGTVSRVLDRLSGMGMVETRHGKGVFVRKFKDQQAARQKIVLLYLTDMDQPITAVNSPFAYTIFEASKQFCSEENLSLSLTPLYSDPKKLTSSLKEICESTKADGLILIYGGEERYRHLLPLLKDTPIPMVFVDKPFGKTRDVSFVSGDNLHIGNKAAEFLVDCGHSNICVIMRPGQRCQQEQLLGFRSALQANELGLADENCYFEDDKHSAVMQVARRIKDSLQSQPVSERITAVHCGSDLDAMALIQTLQGMDISVPGDVTVIGGGGSDMAAHFHPALTSVTVNVREMGIRACEVLQRLMDKPDGGAIHEIIDAYVVERESSSAFRMQEFEK